MPKGVLWLIVGIVIGLLAGWLLVGNPVVGGAAGFIITLVLLLIGNWFGGDGSDDISVTGR